MDNQRIYFPKLDGLRFLAFLLVFFSHFRIHESLFGRFFKNWGWIGVELFFLLSAFLLTTLLIQEYNKIGVISVRKFLLRRILRIWPLYFGFLLLILFIILHAFATGLNLQANMYSRLLGLFTLTDNLFTSILGYNNVPFSQHLWSISFEEQFYLFLPFILPFLIKLNKRTLSFLLAGILLYMLILRFICKLLDLKYPFIYTLLIQGDSLLFGILLAFGIFDKLLNKVKSYILIIIAMCLICSLSGIQNVYASGNSQIYIFTIIALGFFLLVHGVVNSQNKLIQYIFGNPIIRYLGKISYGLYVFHFICIYYSEKLLIHFGVNNNWVFTFFISMILTITVSIISYEFYEKQFLKIKEKYTIVKSRPV